MSKLKLGIDLDDTVWEYHRELFKYCSIKFDKKIEFDNFQEYSISKFFNIDEIQAQKILDNFEHEGFFEEVILIDDFLEIFNSIKDDFEIFFITARPEHTKELIQRRMNKIFDDEFPVFYVRDFDKKIIKSKGEYCQELGIDIMIDDGHHHLMECAEFGVKCLLLDYPWNQYDLNNENITRVKTWKDIMEKLETIVGRKLS